MSIRFYFSVFHSSFDVKNSKTLLQDKRVAKELFDNVCSRLRFAPKTFTKLNISPNNLPFLEVSY